MSMTSRGEIESGKLSIKDIFLTKWFRIPEYQRPYVWKKDQIYELLDDVSNAMSERQDFEYFLGSLVFQSKPADPKRGRNYVENDLLDGQQRMTTLLMLFAVLRDLTDDPEAKEDCQKFIYQKGSKYTNTPERTRILFSTREHVQQFIDEFVKAEGGTNREEDLKRKAASSDNLSIRNMASAIIEIRKFFVNNDRSHNNRPSTEDFLKFLANNVIMIYVSADDLGDAFRLFMILNNRGVQLRNSDILKAINLAELESDEDRIRYAQIWEEAENELGEDFDRFLHYIRTILLKDKARKSLLEEFQEKIYASKGTNEASYPKEPILKPGRETFNLIKRYFEYYREVILEPYESRVWPSCKFGNLVNMMLVGLPSTDWVPPLLRYYDKFRSRRILEFAERLDNKFSADWICGRTRFERIVAMNRIIYAIERAKNEEEVFEQNLFEIDGDSLLEVLDGNVYGRPFDRYILLKLEYLYYNHEHRMHFGSLSVEHILPRNPHRESQWCRDFSDEERREWTDRLGNLILITRRKNASLGRLDYAEKRRRYFEKNVEPLARSSRVLRSEEWTPVHIRINQEESVRKLAKHYGIDASEIFAGHVEGRGDL